jgi:tetratricopeptide (TPR) repeat protein
LGRYVEAQAALEKACQLVDLFPDAQMELAALYERRHRLDESLQLIDRVLTAQPRRPSAMILKARVLRRQGQTTQAEAMLREVVQLDPLRSDLRAQALGDLAQLYDQLEQYETAWTTILESKRILLRQDSKPWSAAQIVFRRFGQSDLSPVRSHKIPVVQLLRRLTPQSIATARTRYLTTMEALLGESIGRRLHLDKNPAMNLMLPVVQQTKTEASRVLAFLGLQWNDSVLDHQHHARRKPITSAI